MVPDSSIMYPIILGNDVLTNEMIMVDLLNGKLSQPLITGCCDIYLGSGDSQPDIVHHQIPLYSAEDIWITNGDPVLVPVCFSQARDCDYYYDGLMNDKHGNLT